MFLFFSETQCDSLYQFDCKSDGCTTNDELCDGTCIYKSMVNDGKDDCADGSDENRIGTIASREGSCVSSPFSNARQF